MNDRGEKTKREILEQPTAFRRTIESIRKSVRRAAESLTDKFVYASGSGTSYHASLVFQRSMSKIAGGRVTCIPASELPFWLPEELSETALVTYSQSGESTDIVSAVKFFRERGGHLVVGITNVEGSTLDKISDISVITRAGKEESIAATKTYTSQLAATLLLSIEIGELRGKDLSDLRSELASVDLKMREVLKNIFERTMTVAEAIKDMNVGFVLGSGANYPTALEGALKLRETANLYYEGFAAREFLHGPIQLVSDRTPVLAILPSRFKEVLRKVRSYGAPVVRIGFDHEDELRIPRISEELSPIIAVIPLQTLAYSLSILRGLNPDRPEKLSKVVK